MQTEDFLKYSLWAYIAFVNTISFALMGLDKKKARDQKYRIPEKTLFIWVIVGGSLGGFLGMKLFRHKTQHLQFKYGFPLILFVHLVFIAVLGLGILPPI